MNVPRMAYSQGGRVLIACDNITFVKEIAVPHRINLWDMADGSLAHQTPDSGRVAANPRRVAERAVPRRDARRQRRREAERAGDWMARTP